MQQLRPSIPRLPPRKSYVRNELSSMFSSDTMPCESHCNHRTYPVVTTRKDKSTSMVAEIPPQARLSRPCHRHTIRYATHFIRSTTSTVRIYNFTSNFTGIDTTSTPNPLWSSRSLAGPPLLLRVLRHWGGEWCSGLSYSLTHALNIIIHVVMF